MKVYLLFLLIGIAFSFSCTKLVTRRLSGTVTGLFSKKCECYDFLYEGIMSDIDSDSCTCFLKEELDECRAHSQCEVAPSIGCQNK